MEYVYSEEVDACLYETHGLCNQIKLRVHKDSVKETKGALRAQEDWSKQVKPIGQYYGGLGDRYSFIRVTVPECLPERLEIISYANEYAFLYDDEMENLDLQRTTGTNGFLETFGYHALSMEIAPATRPEKRLQVQILSEMMAIDRSRAVTSMKAWATFVQLAAETRKLHFNTLEEYIPARVIDAGELIWYGTLTFGMGITIPKDELDLAMKLARPGYAVLGLTNDLYSWNKESRAAKMAGQDSVFNAIWVIMKEQAVDEEDAKKICSDLIQRYMLDFSQAAEAVSKDPSLSRDLRRYIEAVRLSCIGNLVWSIYCPRYQA
ncbi:isoprenoid synthase domain-containing protein [Xylaria palmicola]|nr:isoprenoid synthase domain-containing protein [Xylaria palmicola]